MEKLVNKHFYMMYKFNFSFILGVNKIHNENCVDDEGEIKEKRCSSRELVDAIDLNSSSSLSI